MREVAGLRRDWAGILGVDVAVVNYSYTKVVPKMVHILKYVTRATFREYTWDERMAGELEPSRRHRLVKGVGHRRPGRAIRSWLLATGRYTYSPKAVYWQMPVYAVQYTAEPLARLSSSSTTLG